MNLEWRIEIKISSGYFYGKLVLGMDKFINQHRYI